MYQSQQLPPDSAQTQSINPYMKLHSQQLVPLKV